MHMRKLLSLAAVVAAIAGHSAVASAAVPRPLESLVSLGAAKIIKTFRAPAGLQGYLVAQGGQYEVLYGLRGYLLVGGLISPSGQNETGVLYNKYAPKPDYKKVADSLAHDRYIVRDGHNGPRIYVFEDPNCIFCHKLFVALAPFIREGKLTVDWVPVGFLKPDSAGKAAAILEAHDRLAKFDQDENRFDSATEEGGISPAKPTSAVAQALDTHLREMQTLHANGTPTLLYQVKTGQWASSIGMPPDIAALISHLR